MTSLETRACQNCKNPFTIEPDDFAFYEKMKVPPPTFCPECRAQRRMAFYNLRTLYKRPDSRTGKDIFSAFSPHAPVKVYDHDFWWSDAWDPMEYGRDYDFSRSFFEQFRELLCTVPLSSRSILGLTNSDYCNNAAYLKNCYLTFEGADLENCLYCGNVNGCKDSIDIGYCMHVETGYEAFMSEHSSRLFFSLHCQNCVDVYFSKNCNGCTNCFGCVNLRNKQYHIFNKPYSPEEYRKKIESFNLDSYEALEEMKERICTFWAEHPVKYRWSIRANDSSGEYLYDVRNVRDSYDIVGGENLRYCQALIPSTKDSYDYTTWGLNAEQIYECSDCGRGVANLKFCYDCWPDSHDLIYCMQCHSSSYLFGCIGIRKKQYCILNKQYSREEYIALAGKIVQQMKEVQYRDAKGREYRYGEFFPIEFSPFPYNDTIAQEFFSLTDEQASEKGYPWKKFEEKQYVSTKSWKELPDSIKDVDNGITEEIILCRTWEENSKKALEHNCTKVFRITPDEIVFYKKLNLPLPRKCPNSRHFDRIQQRNPIRLWKKRCQCFGEASENGVYRNQSSHFHGASHCQNQFETSYAPNRPEIVYCEPCYQAEVA